MRKAFTIHEIDTAVNKFQPVPPDHPFYVPFEGVRGDFQEQELMNMLGVRTEGGQYSLKPTNDAPKTLIFLAGMRGSGKTSELARIARKINRPECFFVVTCNVDEGLDMDNIQYMDIVIFQLEQLLNRVKEEGLVLNEDIVQTMQQWFDERVVEINCTLKAEGSAEIAVSTEEPFSIGSLLGKLLGLTGQLRAGLSGSTERAETIRKSLQNRFGDFAKKFEAFIELVNEQLRRFGKAQEVLFMVDGLEKTMSAETRRKIIMEESNRIRQIKANTIFTLPIELMKEEQRIRQFAEIVNFPFIKVKERDGAFCKEAVRQLRAFIERRIALQLFENEDAIMRVIECSGGSPRQLLRIIEQAQWFTHQDEDRITLANIERAIEKLGNNLARYLDEDDFKALKKLREDLEKGNPVGFSDRIQELLEKEIIFEYNDGTYKRVNPLLEVSKLYRHHVLNAP